MPAWVSDEWEWTEHVESIDVVELDLIYLGDINTLRKQVFMPLIQKLSLLRYLEEVKNEASEDIK